MGDPRELDAQVAQLVMGWKPVEFMAEFGWLYETGVVLKDGYRVQNDLLHFSTRIEDAFLVVEKMRERGYSFGIFGLTQYSSAAPHELCIFKRSVFAPESKDGKAGLAFRGNGDTFAECICKAALAAIEAEKETNEPSNG